MRTERQAVLNSLDALESASWYMVLCATRGVLRGMSEVLMPDPTRENAAIAVIDTELERLEAGQGRT